MDKRNILIIDDERSDIDLIKEALSESENYLKVNSVLNGSDALDYLNKIGEYEDVETPDFILLDINIPNMDGHEILRKIKSNKRLKYIPIVVFTSSSSKREILKIYEEGGNSFVTKPLKLTEFLEIVRKIEEFWIEVNNLPSG